MASPGNQHCANCIGTLSFPIGKGQIPTVAATIVEYILCLLDESLHLVTENPAVLSYVSVTFYVETHKT